MARSSLERRLGTLSGKLKALRQEIAVADEQLAHFSDEADDARIRALVSETPLAEREHREAQRHAEAMAAHRASLVSEVARLEKLQDELLDAIMDRQRGR